MEEQCWVCGRDTEIDVKTAKVHYGGETIEVGLCVICYTLLNGEIEE